MCSDRNQPMLFYIGRCSARAIFRPYDECKSLSQAGGMDDRVSSCGLTAAKRVNRLSAD